MLRLLVLLCLQLLLVLQSEGTECGIDQFQCSNGPCIGMNWKCDGSPDCFDDSDEKDCPKTTCSDGYFRCDDGKCISDRWVCDDLEDCDDGSDEVNCNSKNKTCDGFKCNETNSCIPSSWQCDGKPDCLKEDDEQGCGVCSETEFQCKNDQCIDLNWKCDEHEDCIDGSDEINCGDCGEDEFKCADGKCINSQWRCDGDNDCKDGSDETNCTFSEVVQNQTCDPNMFQCTTPLNEAKCIAIAWRCDGDEDCPDGSDEDEEKCEGIRTCASDEKLCVEDKYCVKKVFFCDHQDDCLDGSDELNCNFTVTPVSLCAQNQFDCHGDGKTCILDKYKCDGSNDCDNFADEVDCPAKGSEKCPTDNGGCQHLCVPIPQEPYRVCECNAGFELKNGSETDCVDIDECKIPGTCSQSCTNTKGSYKCECEDDYVLTDHRYCKANGDTHPELILSDDYDIRRYELSTYHYTLLLDQHATGAVAIDFDIRNNMVYWAGTNLDGVLCADIKTNTVKTMLTEHMKVPDGLAVDWVHGNLYVSDTGYDHIIVSRLDGSNSKILLNEDMDEPRAVVVDPYHGWMYWTDWGSDPKIEKCGMNGKQRKAIVTENIVWPNGLAIDYVDSRLYWVDAKMHQIGSTDLDGGDFRLVVKGHKNLGHPFAITVFEDFIYWTDWVNNAVFKSSKFGTGNTSTVALNLKTPMDIRVYHIYRQPSRLNHCGTNYGGCSHLCLPVPQSVTSTHLVKQFECACPTGMILEDGHNCISSPSGVTTKPIKPSSPDTDTKGNPNRPNVPKPTTPTPVITSEGKTPTEKPKEVTTEVTVNYVETTEKHQNGTQEKLGDEGSPMGHIAGIAVAVILGVSLLLGIVVFLMVRRYKKKNVKSMNFDNPVYRKTTTDDQVLMDKDAANSRIERESMQPLNQDPEVV